MQTISKNYEAGRQQALQDLNGGWVLTDIAVDEFVEFMKTQQDQCAEFWRGYRDQLKATGLV